MIGFHYGHLTDQRIAQELDLVVDDGTRIEFGVFLRQINRGGTDDVSVRRVVGARENEGGAERQRDEREALVQESLRKVCMQQVGGLLESRVGMRWNAFG